MSDGSILAITSKVVALCEGSVVPLENADKEELIKQQSEFYLPRKESKYEHSFTFLNNTLIAVAGIDESNAAGTYALWPQDPQASANQARKHVAEKFGLKKVGVIVTDSTSFPLRYGTKGISIAHSGFKALNDYRGQKDLFGHEFEVSMANIAEGLAAAAVVIMGEGTEQTPMAIISEASFVHFQENNPTEEELVSLRLTLENDLFEPFLTKAPWQKGGRKK